jgi:site-specific DNA-methyltransferase (adenine-specific)
MKGTLKNMTEIPQVIQIQDIVIQSRIRKDLGDIPGLANSIKENGLIEPIVLTHDWYPTETNLDGIETDPDKLYNPIPYIKLVAGERRLTALKSLGIQELIHAVHYVWRSELESNDPKKKLLFSAIEMEENVRRKDLSWQEQVLGKAKLLAIMQEIYGEPTQGRPSEAQKSSSQPGFGVRKLAAMLGESAAQTSEDLSLASLLDKVPSLKSEANREDARRKFTSEAIKALISMKTTTKPIDESFATMYQGSFLDNIHNVPDESVDLIYTDLPYGVNLDVMDKHQVTELDYDDARIVIVGMLENIARESYRILKNDRFAVFWFGFNYYKELFDALTLYGFEVNPVPFIWLKNTSSAMLPLLLYANSYEQALVIRKGVPRFIRPGQKNSAGFQSETSKLHIAQQPVELVKRFIEDMTLPDATVVDLMCGSGTTGVAALELGRKAILFEQDKAIFDYAKVRIEDTIKRIKK